MDEWDVKGMLHAMKPGMNHYYRCTIALLQAIITYTRLANIACHFWVVRRELGRLVRGWAANLASNMKCVIICISCYTWDGITVRIDWAADLASNMKWVIA
jgi:hypothetical protein